MVRDFVCTPSAPSFLSVADDIICLRAGQGREKGNCDDIDIGNSSRYNAENTEERGGEMATREVLQRILGSEWAKNSPILMQFRGSEYNSLLKAAMEQLDYAVLYKSWLHGTGHIERVILLGALIAWCEQLDESDTKLLLTACSYHDIGRINDRREDEHGRRAAAMLAGEKFYLHEHRIPESDRGTLYAMVTTHSLSDKKMPTVAQEYGLSEAEMPRYLNLAGCLKDADNLDRARLGDLDPTRLRHRSSRNLVLFAEALYREYD